MKNLKRLFVLGLTSVMILPTVTYAVPSKPSGGNGGGTPPNSKSSTSSSSNISYSGITEFTSNKDESDKTYTSTEGSKNALLVSGGTSTISNPNVEKTGDADGDEADFYGVNAAILTYNGATLNINGGNIITDGAHANAVFAYKEGIININNTNIKTSSNNSGALMVTGGGTLTATNVTAETDGNSSAPIRSDRGGGTLTVNKGTYISHGTGSPVIYSTADITVNDASLTSTASEGVVVEGKNSVTLNNVTMEATNTKLNGNSETYKSIFIYQSMSGDADVGTSEFTSKNSKIINNKGEIIFVTNTTTLINLENNEIINNDETGAFMKIGAAKWGNSGSNGGNVTLNMTNQKVDGDIIVDEISTLILNLSEGSIFKGSINKDNEAKEVNINLSKDSIIVLTDDTYIDSLENEVSDNSNIYLNGHKLYVNGKEISANNNKYVEIKENKETVKNTNKSDNKNYTIYYVLMGCIIILGIVIVIVLKRNKSN